MILSQASWREANLYWYAGVGATVGIPLKSDVDFNLGAVGEIGLEYRFLVRLLWLVLITTYFYYY